MPFLLQLALYLAALLPQRRTSRPALHLSARRCRCPANGHLPLLAQFFSIRDPNGQLFLCYCFCLLPLFGLGRLFGILYRLLPASFCWAGVGPRFRYTANMANMLAIAVDLWPFSLYALWQSLCSMPDLRRISPCFLLVF